MLGQQLDKEWKKLYTRLKVSSPLGGIMYKIMIIEDDLTIARTLKEHLSKWDYNTIYLTDFKNIMEQFRDFEPHIVLLDVMLPFFNGFHWCNEIRKISKVPVMFVSSAGDNMNIVMAMNMGGDDFIVKPFDLNVLTAKLGAMLRRAYSLHGQINEIEHNGVVLNLNDTTLNYDNNKIELTKNEYKILQLLMENTGKVVSRDEIMQRLWESDQFIDDNTLTVNMTRLRKKLSEFGLDNYIKTKKGLGYLVE
ncbi:MAG: two component transcriptional regulator, winged helix family [Sedimentibacter sp.]|nr:two component transcriptional regulator, winged helix family [Sedimentibacter sp.]